MPDIDTDPASALWTKHSRLSRDEFTGIMSLMLRGDGWPRSVAEEHAAQFADIAEEVMAEVAAKALN